MVFKLHIYSLNIPQPHFDDPLFLLSLKMFISFRSYSHTKPAFRIIEYYNNSNIFIVFTFEASVPFHLALMCCWFGSMIVHCQAGMQPKIKTWT